MQRTHFLLDSPEHPVQSFDKLIVGFSEIIRGNVDVSDRDHPNVKNAHRLLTQLFPVSYSNFKDRLLILDGIAKERPELFRPWFIKLILSFKDPCTSSKKFLDRLSVHPFDCYSMLNYHQFNETFFKKNKDDRAVFFTAVATRDFSSLEGQVEYRELLDFTKTRIHMLDTDPKSADLLRLCIIRIKELDSGKSSLPHLSNSASHQRMFRQEPASASASSLRILKKNNDEKIILPSIGPC